MIRSEHRDLFLRKIPELIQFESLIKKALNSPVQARLQIEATIHAHEVELPVVSLTMGSRDPSAPVLAIFGGVHGLERIGSDVALAWLDAFLSSSQWDTAIQKRLTEMRIVILPIVNPAGFFASTRSNANGVDLMRNAPVRADDPPWLLGGHRYSAKLPWFSGAVATESDMELEAQAVQGLIDRELSKSKFALSIDIHSGFGAVDRLWFPWAKSKAPPPYLSQIQAFKDLLDSSHPQHVYHIEPQSKSYTTHGDLWDWALEKHLRAPAGPFVPWTLELGSWIWLKKNPIQLFTQLGSFNPILPHRRKRILRRHMTLLDFFVRAVANAEAWSDFNSEHAKSFENKALDHWYRKVA